jgi:hypothetical protein
MLEDLRIEDWKEQAAGKNRQLERTDRERGSAPCH